MISGSERNDGALDRRQRVIASVDSEDRLPCLSIGKMLAHPIKCDARLHRYRRDPPIMLPWLAHHGLLIKPDDAPHSLSRFCRGLDKTRATRIKNRIELLRIKRRSLINDLVGLL